MIDDLYFTLQWSHDLSAMDTVAQQQLIGQSLCPSMEP